MSSYGFSLEIVISRRVFTLLYLLTGIGADLLFIAFNGDSYAPLIGASGAIAGLMGMYIAVYGLRKIKFFYTVVFYADYFKAPALIVFAVWVLKELYGVFVTGGNVAYWAHLGGMFSGFAVI